MACICGDTVVDVGSGQFFVSLNVSSWHSCGCVSGSDVVKNIIVAVRRFGVRSCNYQVNAVTSLCGAVARVVFRQRYCPASGKPRVAASPRLPARWLNGLGVSRAQTIFAWVGYAYGTPDHIESVSIFPQWQNKRLCKPFMRFVLRRLYANSHTPSVYLAVQSETPRVCACYVRAALDERLRVLTEETAEPLGDIPWPYAPMRKVVQERFDADWCTRFASRIRFVRADPGEHAGGHCLKASSSRDLNRATASCQDGY